MKKFVMRMALTAVALALGATATSRAGATGYAYSAIQGKGWPLSAQDCFENAWTQVTNTCSTTKTFLIPIVSNNSPRTMYFYVQAYGNLTDQVTCHVVENDAGNGGWYSSSGWTVGNSIKTYQTLDLWQMYVEEGHTLHVDCSVKPTAAVLGVLTS